MYDNVNEFKKTFNAFATSIPDFIDTKDPIHKKSFDIFSRCMKKLSFLVVDYFRTIEEIENLEIIIYENLLNIQLLDEELYRKCFWYIQSVIDEVIKLSVENEFYEVAENFSKLYKNKKEIEKDNEL